MLDNLAAFFVAFWATQPVAAAVVSSSPEATPSAAHSAPKSSPIVKHLVRLGEVARWALLVVLKAG